MIRRIFWLALGLGLGVLVGAFVVRRVDQATRAVSPSRLAGGAGHAAGTMVARFREALEEGREAAAAHERDLRSIFEIPSIWDLLGEQLEDRG